MNFDSNSINLCRIFIIDNIRRITTQCKEWVLSMVHVMVGGMQQCKAVDCKKEACDVYDEGWQVYYIVLPTVVEGVTARTMINLSTKGYAQHIYVIRMVTNNYVTQKGGCGVVQSIAMKHVLHKVKVAKSIMPY